MTRTDTPKFFKKVQVMGGSMVAAAASLAGIAGLNNPIFIHLIGFLATAGGVMVCGWPDGVHQCSRKNKLK